MTTTKQASSKTIPFSDLEAELGAASERYEDGLSHARQSAKKAAGDVKHAFKVGVFNTAFGISYGLVFSSVFLTELLPEDSTVRRGLEEGADAALEAHARLKGHNLDEDETDEEEVELEEEEKPQAAAKSKRSRNRNGGGKSAGKSAE